MPKGAPMPGSFRSRFQRRVPSHGRLRIELLEDRTLPSFVTATSIVVGSNSSGFFSQSSKPVAVAVGDFNGDGNSDVATANESGPGVSVLLGTGKGTFLPRVNYATGPTPAGILAADVNGDGRLDIVTANKGNDTISVLRGRGDGTFKAAVSHAVGVDPVSVAVGDVNGDSRQDLAVANSGAGTVTLLMGTTAGTFTPGGTIAVGTSPTSVVLADFNNDNKLDLASVTGGFGHLDVNLGNGDGSFAAKVNYTTGFVAKTVVVGFFNADAQPDLAVACDFPSGDGVSILLGNPDGTFQPFTNYGAGGQNPATLVVADLNGDGFQDLVTANKQFANNSISVLTGTGTGIFDPARVYTAGQGPVGVAVADFNSDGRPDVVTANHDEEVGSISLLRGNGNGTLSAAPNLIAPGAGPIATGDLTGDGIVDLAVVNGSASFSGVTIFPSLGNGLFAAPLQSETINQANGIAVRDVNGDFKSDLIVTTSSGVRVLLGNGNGTFAAGVDYAAGTSPKWVVVDNFDADTILDLAIANDSGTGVSILLGNGDGTFDAAVGVNGGGASSYLESGDFNRDGKRDLAVVNNSIEKVSIVFGNGNGTFGTPKSYTTQVGPGSVGVGDFNRDGKPDLAIPTFFSNGGNLAILRNAAGGSFVTGPKYTTGSRPIGNVVADLTGDGKLDLAIVNNFSDDLYVFPGTGTGTFGAPKKYVVGDRPDWIASADFNGDGKLDLAVVNGNAGTITLLETPAPATTIRVSIVPSETLAGTAFKVVVTALDAGGRLATNFTGTVKLTSSDSKAVLPLAYTFAAADAGVKRFNVTLKTAGDQSVHVQSGALGATDSVAVVAANASQFQVVAPASSTVGVAFNVTVTALDRFGNVAVGYVGTVRFTSTAPALALLPPNYTFQASDNGVSAFSVTHNKTGLQTLTVADIVKPTLKKSRSLTITP